MTNRVAPLVPNALPIRRALDNCEPLTRLSERLARSEACMAAIRPALPPMLRQQVKAGPVDDEGWTLLAANTGVAAKLRQLLPRLEAALPAWGGKATPIRIRIQSAPQR